MSRSYRKNPITGITTCESEKFCKKNWHARLRRAFSQQIHKILKTNQDDVPIKENQICSVYEMEKDGKKFFDKKKFPHLMRK